MTRKRFRIRTLLIAVALAAFLAWAATLPLRARSYRLLAAKEDAALKPLREDLRYAQMMLDDLSWYQPALASDLEHWQKIHRDTLDAIAHHLKWRDIYAQAGRRPWIRVPSEVKPAMP